MSPRRREAPRGRPARPWLLGLLALVSLGCKPTERELPGCLTVEPDAGALVGQGDPGESPVLVGAGDIASCESGNEAEATALLLDSIPGTVFTAGDNAYPASSIDDYLDCYGPSWGRHRARTRPSPGNHEYDRPHAGPYFAYFCGSAGPPLRGYYSYDLGRWHIISLNSNGDAFEVGGALVFGVALGAP